MYIVVEQYVRYLQNGVEYTVARLECDTIADLPLPTGSYKPGVGSKAHVVEDNSWWAYKSTDQWVLQEAGTSAYTKAEVDAIIQSLDANTVGGSGKYIQSIYETDGIIYATPATIQTSVNTSSNAVSSNAVKTYVDNGLATKIGIDDILGQGTRIQNANMDDYWQPGNYYIATADDLANITNKPDPVYSSRARVVVLQFTGTSTSNYRSVQIWIPQILGTDNARYYMRYRTTNSQGVVSWTSWKTFAEATALMGMGTNPYIAEDQTGINLNDYTIAGTYIKQYNTNVSTFLNCPIDGTSYPVASFKLIVEYVNSPNNIRQTLIPLYESTGYFIRMRMTGANGTWKAWQYYGGTVVQLQNNLQSLGGDMRSSAPDEEEIIDEER